MTLNSPDSSSVGFLQIYALKAIWKWLQFSSLQNLELLFDLPLQIRCLLYITVLLWLIASNFSLFLDGPPNLHETSRWKPSVRLKIGFRTEHSPVHRLHHHWIRHTAVILDVEGITALQIAEEEEEKEEEPGNPCHRWRCQHSNIRILLQDRANFAECARLNSAHYCEECIVICVEGRALDCW